MVILSWLPLHFFFKNLFGYFFFTGVVRLAFLRNNQGSSLIYKGNSNLGDTPIFHWSIVWLVVSTPTSGNDPIWLIFFRWVVQPPTRNCGRKSESTHIGVYPRLKKDADLPTGGIVLGSGRHGSSQMWGSVDGAMSPFFEYASFNNRS